MTSTPPTPTLSRKRRRESKSDSVAASSVVQPAQFWRRITAMIYDVFPLIGLWMITSLLCLLAIGGHYDPAHPRWTFRLGLQLALLAITAAYFTISWTRIGATIGMRAWKLKLLREDGQRVEALRALARFFLALLSLLIVGVGFWWALLDRDRQTLHDKLCGTMMVMDGGHQVAT